MADKNQGKTDKAQAKEIAKILKEQLSSKEESGHKSKELIRLQKEENDSVHAFNELQKEIALQEKKILKLVEARIKSSSKMKDLQDEIKKSTEEQTDKVNELNKTWKLIDLKKKKIAELEEKSDYSSFIQLQYLKQELGEQEQKKNLLKTQLYQIGEHIFGAEELLNIEREHIKELNNKIGVQEEFLGTLQQDSKAQLKSISATQAHTKTLHEAAHAAEELVEKYEEMFEPLEEIDAWMQKMPGGGLLSKALGLDGIGKKIKQQVVDQLAAGKASGMGMVASLAPLIPLLIAAGLLMKAFEFDTELTQFSKDLDVSKRDAMELSVQADELAGHLGVAGVNGVEVGKAMKTIHDEMGTTAALADKELVGAVALLQTRIGLSGEEAMALNSTATMLGTTLNELAASSYDMADGLIGGKAMLKEMAKLPKSLVAGFKGTTQQLQKAIVKGKLFGLTIEQASKAGESMLDIESSIEKEMTANVLTGKHMNLNRARQLALTGSQAELQDEILKQAGSLEDYQKMSPLQQKAMSDALGLSSEEMANMLTKSEEMRKVGLSQVKVEEMMTGSLEEQQKNIDGMSDAKQKSYLQDLLNKKKQEEATAKFQDSMTKLNEAFQKTMMPVVEFLGEILGYIGDVIHYLTIGVEKFNHWYHELTGVTGELKEGDGIMGKLVKGALAVGAAIWLWSKGMKLVGKMKSFDIKSMIPGMGGGSKTPETPDTSKMDKAKGKGSEGGLTSLAGGLKAMGQSGITKGILNTALAGPALLLSLPSIPFLAFIGKVKLDKLEENFTGLGNGLKAMDGTFKGVAATGAFGIAGGLALVSIPFLLVFGKVKLDKLQENFIALGTGLQSMSGTMMGSAGLGAFAIAGALAIPSLIFLGIFGKVSFGSLLPNFTGLAEGLMLMSPTLLGSAALAAFGLAALIAIPSLIFLGGIALLGAVASAGLIALGTGLASLGAVAATGLPFIAVGLIAALGLAMIPFGIALAESAPGIRAFAEVLGAMGPIIIATFEGIGTVIDKISGGIAMIITTIATSIKSLADLDPLRLIAVAGGIGMVGMAIAGFGAGAGAGGIMAGIGKFFDEDPVEKFNRFAKIDSSKLLQVAASIKSLGETIGSFGTAMATINIDQLDSVGESIDRIGTSIADFGAKAGAGGAMSAIGSFFDEDPVEKFNRFATIDSAKLIEVATAIDKLGDAIAKFSSQVGKIGEVSGIIETIDKVMELHDAVSENPISEAVEGVASAVGDIFAKAASFVTSTPTADTVDTTGGSAPADSAAPAGGQGSLTEVAGLLKQLIAATSQPVKINIGGRVIDEIEKLTTLRKTYSATVDKGYGTNG